MSNIYDKNLRGVRLRRAGEGFMQGGLSTPCGLTTRHWERTECEHFTSPFGQSCTLLSVMRKRSKLSLKCLLKDLRNGTRKFRFLNFASAPDLVN